MFFNLDNIFINVKCNTKESILEYIAKKASENGITDDYEGLLKDLKARELESSTGIEDGFAIPHARSEKVKCTSLIYIKTVNGVEWETFDGRRVRYIFSLLVPEEDKDNVHLKMLSKIATCLLDEDFKKDIISTEDKKKLYERISKRIKEDV